VKSPIQYFGSKANIADRLIEMMPAHRGYIEPFAGSLSVLLAKPAAKIEVVNDLDENLMTFWRVLRDRPDDLIRVAELTPHSRAELEAAAALDADDELERARQVWVMLTQGRSRTMKRTGWRFFADPNGTSSSFMTYMDAYRSRLGDAFERIREVSLECRPALDVIAQYGAFPENLLYVDPPYLYSTRSTRAGNRYTHELGSADEHTALAAALHECKASVMISGYPAPEYLELYGDWNYVGIAARSDNALNRDRVEGVWMNYTPDNYLDFSILGEGALA
jgi:DNA adenine methylase